MRERANGHRGDEMDECIFTTHKSLETMSSQSYDMLHNLESNHFHAAMENTPAFNFAPPRTNTSYTMVSLQLRFAQGVDMQIQSWSKLHKLIVGTMTTTQIPTSLANEGDEVCPNAFGTSEQIFPGIFFLTSKTTKRKTNTLR